MDSWCIHRTPGKDTSSISNNYDSIFNGNFWSNNKILWSVVISIVLTMIAIYVPFINGFLGFAPLVLSDWLSVLAAAAVFLLAHEGVKMFKRSRRKAP